MENLVFIWKGYANHEEIQKKIETALAAGVRVVIYDQSYDNGIVFSDTSGNSLPQDPLKKAFEQQKGTVRMFLKKGVWDMDGFGQNVFQYDEEEKYFSKDGSFLGEKQSAILSILNLTDEWAVRDNLAAQPPRKKVMYGFDFS